MTGEPGRSAPQLFAASPGTKNIRCGCQLLPRSFKYCCFDSMKHIAPGSSAGSSFLSSAVAIAATISGFDFPASTSLVFIRKMGRKVFAAGGLKQWGARTLGFQNSGSSVAAPQDRSTTQRKPFVPFTAVVYPCGPSTITSAASEIDAGAALRASAISELTSAVRYWSRGAMAG